MSLVDAVLGGVRDRWIALVVLTIDSLIGVRQRRLRGALDDGVCEPVL